MNCAGWLIGSGKTENTDFWMFVLMAGIMGVVGGLLGNFFQEIIVRILDALGSWWGS